MIRTDKGASPIPQHHGYGTSPMSPREPQHTPPKTLAMNSSRDMLEKLRREIDRLAGSIIRQEIVDHGLNAAMTAWHLTDWTWREIQGSIPRFRSLTASAGTPIRELKQFQEFVKKRLRRASGVFHQGDRAIPNWATATSPARCGRRSPASYSGHIIV